MRWDKDKKKCINKKPFWNKDTTTVCLWIKVEVYVFFIPGYFYSPPPLSLSRIPLLSVFEYWSYRSRPFSGMNVTDCIFYGQYIIRNSNLRKPLYGMPYYGICFSEWTFYGLFYFSAESTIVQIVTKSTIVHHSLVTSVINSNYSTLASQTTSSNRKKTTYVFFLH